MDKRMNPLITLGIFLLILSLFAKFFLGLLKIVIFLIHAFLSLIVFLGLSLLFFGFLKELVRRSS